MAEGALEMEFLSPWELCEGNLEGLPPGDPEGYLEKSVDGHLYIGAPVFWEPRGGLVYQGL